jgi:hypothetical protein
MLAHPQEDEMARKATDTVNLRLRMPDALHRELVTAAEKAQRSLNSEILWRVGQTFGEEWQRFIAGQEERQRREEEDFERVMQNPKMQATLKRVMADLRAGKFKEKAESRRKKEG